MAFWEEPSLVTWLTLPVLFVVGIWILALLPDLVLAVFPALCRSYNYAALTQVIAPHPKTMYEAWQLGKLAGELTSAKTEEEVAAILDEASRIAGRNVTKEELEEVGQVTLEMQEARGFASRVIGLFSLVNFLWGMAILGILFTITPTLLYIMDPVMQLLATFYIGYLWPLLVALKPLYEVLAYLAVYMLAVEGHRYPKDTYSMTGIWLVVTSLGLFVALFFYTTEHHAPKESLDFTLLIYLFLLLTLAPNAVVFQSTLLGSLTVVALFTTLFIAFDYLSRVFGFADDPGMLRTSSACLVLHLIYMAMRIAGTPREFTKPFAIGVGSFGGTVYFLALLAFAYWHNQTYSSYAYWIRQLPICISLVVFVAVGKFFGLPSIANTAMMFSVLYFGEKFCEVTSELEQGPMAVCWFMGSVALYFGALYLHRHPALVAALLDAVCGRSLV